VPADILIYAIVAAGLVFWLRSILGTRSGDERQRPNPFTPPRPEPLKNQPAAEVAAGQTHGILPEQPADLNAGLERNMSIENQNAERALLEIARADRSFELPHFLSGAQDAFILIIESFAAGDKETLRGLLAAPVFTAFEKVIDERMVKSEKASVEIHAIRKTEVLDAQVRDKTIFITVRFTADETSIVRDQGGKVVFGDPERVTETIDVWTFARRLKGAREAWQLIATREDAGDQLSGSTVPDTK